MGLIHLVRHGQASFEADDYDVLSPMGHVQARLVGAAFASLRPDVVVHGALRRQADTASAMIAAAGWEVPVEVDPGWDEMDHRAVLGKLDRLPEESFQEWFERASARWTSGDHDDYDESFAVFRRRSLAALERVADRGTVVVVTSGGPIAAATTALLRADAATYRALAPVVVNTSITRIVSGRRGLSLLTFNEHEHLTPDVLTYR